MMALQIMVILQVIVILFSPSSHAVSYPIYGTKRYGRANSRVTTSSAAALGLPSVPYQMVRTQRYPPMNYYDPSYPYYYSQNYPGGAGAAVDDYYYPQESYPAAAAAMYYPPARTSKYEVYQAVMPYYYEKTPIGARPPASAAGAMGYGAGYYGGYDDPDLQEEMIQQEVEREEREESQPIGHELLYENEDHGNMGDDDMADMADGSLDDVNAAFLQNLIMSQMISDADNNGPKEYHHPGTYYDQYGDYADQAYGKWEPQMPHQRPNSNYYNQEDEDVRELKQLAKPNNNNRNRQPVVNTNDVHWFQKPGNQRHITNGNKNNNNNNNNNAYAEKRASLRANNKLRSFTDRKPVLKIASTSTTSTTEVPSTTLAPPKRDARGQKEEVLMRPATPVRHPFSSPVLEMMSTKNNDSERKQTPSVYDTIRHMLEMEKSLENKYRGDDIRPQMRKRIISSEESLTQQLSVLKKDH